MKDLRDRINSSGRRNPGSFLREHLMAMNATQAELADALGVSRVWLNGLLTGRCSVSAGMALRLGHVLATGPAPWIFARPRQSYTTICRTFPSCVRVRKCGHGECRDGSVGGGRQVVRRSVYSRGMPAFDRIAEPPRFQVELMKI